VAFVQIIEVTTTRMSEIEALMEDWLQRPKGVAAPNAAY